MNHLEYVIKVADRVVTATDTEWAMNVHAFDWVPGVGLYGVYQAYVMTKKQEYLQFLMDWVEEHKKDAFCLKTVNSTAPFLTIIELCRETGKEEYKELCMEAAEWILHDAPRTKDGGIEHTVTEDVEGFHEQVWADSLFMVCLFMAKAGVVLRRKEYTDFAIEQLIVHHRLLKNKYNGLYYHGYSGLEKNHMSGACWGRANAWIIYGTNVILREVGDFEEKEEIISALSEQIASLERYQHENGGFSTVLDFMDTYLETSATAGIAAGIYMAVHGGYVDASYRVVADKALQYVMAQTNEKGEVLRVSGGTPVLPKIEIYSDVPYIITLYGQALAIFAAYEADNE